MKTHGDTCLVGSSAEVEQTCKPVPICQQLTNLDMSIGIEGDVAARVGRGERVDYEVCPIAWKSEFVLFQPHS